jgi:hypothetical protein
MSEKGENKMKGRGNVEEKNEEEITRKGEDVYGRDKTYNGEEIN